MLREAMATVAERSGEVEDGRAWVQELREVFARLTAREAAAVLVLAELSVVESAVADAIEAELRVRVADRRPGEGLDESCGDRAETAYLLGLLAGLESRAA